MHLGTYLMNAMLLKTSKVGSIIFNFNKKCQNSPFFYRRIGSRLQQPEIKTRF